MYSALINWIFSMISEWSSVIQCSICYRRKRANLNSDTKLVAVWNVKEVSLWRQPEMRSRVWDFSWLQPCAVQLVDKISADCTASRHRILDFLSLSSPQRLQIVWKTALMCKYHTEGSTMKPNILILSLTNSMQRDWRLKLGISSSV